MLRWCLLLVASILALATWLWTGSEPSHDSEHGPALPKVFHFAPDEVVSLRLSDGSSTRSLTRDERGRWLDEKGEEDSRVPPALELFLRARVERRIPMDASTRVEMGFESPALSLQLGRVLAEGSLSMRFGRLAPDGLSRFLWVQGAPEIITIPDYHAETLGELLTGD